MKKECNVCFGSGFESSECQARYGDSVECTYCNGTGFVKPLSGWLDKDCISKNELIGDGYIYVHQTSPDALEGEAVVEYDPHDDIVYVCIDIDEEKYPKLTKGKRVRWIIEMIEEGE